MNKKISILILFLISLSALYVFFRKGGEDAQIVSQELFEVISVEHPLILQDGKIVIRGQTTDKPIKLILRGSLKAGDLPVVSMSRNGVSMWGLGLDGERVFLVEPNTTYELFCTPREGTVYHIEDLTVESSMEISTDADLKLYLLESIPALSEALGKDRLQAALLLLDWASVVSDLGKGLKSTKKAPVLTVSGMTAAEIYYEMFLPDLYGSSCGGMAVFFNKVLRLFDYPSFTIDCGFDAKYRLTHVTTIVPIQRGNLVKLYLLDPTFNAYFVDGTGDLIDIVSLLKRSVAKNLTDVRFKHAAFIPRDVVFPSTMRAKKMDNYICEAVDREPALKVCREFPYSLESLLKGWDKRLKAVGVVDKRLLLLDMIRTQLYFVGQSPVPEFRELFITSATAAGARLTE